MSPAPLLPRLRPLESHTIIYEGMQYVSLQDPLRISDKTLLTPQPLIPLLALMDGAHDSHAMRDVLAKRFGIRLAISQIDQLVQSFDEACFLENEHYRAIRRALEAQYRSAAFRPAAHAGQVYPEHPDQLLEALAVAVQALPAAPTAAPKLRGLLSPHIDYERGAPVYAHTWQQATASAASVEQVILLGTDHYAEGLPFSLTRLGYVTPLGHLPTRLDWVEGLAEIIGQETAFRGELHHRSEHSIELAAVWLQATLHGKTVDFLPILCGPLNAFEDGAASLHADPTLARVATYLQRIVAQRPTWVIAAGDLSHVGPAFGGPPITAEGQAELRAYDQVALQSILQGDADTFYRFVQQEHDRSNICGLSPIYWLLRILDGCQGDLQAYQLCPADAATTSFVSIAGVTFR